MVSRYAEADLAVDFEAARGREKAEGRRAQRVRRREDDAAVVDAGFVGRGGGRAAQREVPFEEVVFEGLGVVVGGGIIGELGGFSYCAEVSLRVAEDGRCSERREGAYGCA